MGWNGSSYRKCKVMLCYFLLFLGKKRCSILKRFLVTFNSSCFVYRPISKAKKQMRNIIEKEMRAQLTITSWSLWVLWHFSFAWQTIKDLFLISKFLIKYADFESITNPIMLLWSKEEINLRFQNNFPAYHPQQGSSLK